MKKQNSPIIGILIFFIFMSLFAENVFALFILAIILAFYIKSKSKKELNVSSSIQSNKVVCKKCGFELETGSKFCGNCGEKIEVVSTTTGYLKSSDFDIIYFLPEKDLVEEFIFREMKKLNIDSNKKMIPSKLLKRKNIFNIILSFLVFVYVSLIFFHFPLYTYILGFIVLILLLIFTRRYKLINYLRKSVKQRPQEKISNIVASECNSLVRDTSKASMLLGFIVAIVISLVLFINPRIIYEKMDNGYGVRFYAFGITNYKSASIPETYKGKPIISLRGNAFSNMPFLEKAILPDSIKEIRGQAFKNDIKLKEVKLPNSLEYLGGGAFYNCMSLESISMPDTVTFLGGESFYNATSLRSVRLSNNITEIRGNTFEGCSSLESIVIPDSVTRIGGHAFYGNSSLSEVVFTQNSNLTEIGSSAFRRCYSLNSITIRNGVYINERAFKESPTIINYFENGDSAYEY